MPIPKNVSNPIPLKSDPCRALWRNTSRAPVANEWYITWSSSRINWNLKFVIHQHNFVQEERKIFAFCWHCPQVNFFDGDTHRAMWCNKTSYHRVFKFEIHEKISHELKHIRRPRVNDKNRPRGLSFFLQTLFRTIRIVYKCGNNGDAVRRHRNNNSFSDSREGQNRKRSTAKLNKIFAERYYFPAYGLTQAKCVFRLALLFSPVASFVCPPICLMPASPSQAA